MDISREELYEQVWATPCEHSPRSLVSQMWACPSPAGAMPPDPAAGLLDAVEHGKAPKRPLLPVAPHGDTVSLSEGEALRSGRPPFANATEVSVNRLAHAEQAVADLDLRKRRRALLEQGCQPDWASAFGKKLVEEERPRAPYA
jgi:hypothetical protein